mmetsp:Transcript_1108/g.3365  ORF Transcript_1108/g.3365 Transcript_1108/m.3365 type:complete len:200 (-) Transcript_1108:322-921(-)
MPWSMLPCHLRLQRPYRCHFHQRSSCTQRSRHSRNCGASGNPMLCWKCVLRLRPTLRGQPGGTWWRRGSWRCPLITSRQLCSPQTPAGATQTRQQESTWCTTTRIPRWSSPALVRLCVLTAPLPPSPCCRTARRWWRLCSRHSIALLQTTTGVVPGDQHMPAGGGRRASTAWQPPPARAPSLCRTRKTPPPHSSRRAGR